MPFNYSFADLRLLDNCTLLKSKLSFLAVAASSDNAAIRLNASSYVGFFDRGFN